jgi:hypothetical protein
MIHTLQSCLFVSHKYFTVHCCQLLISIVPNKAQEMLCSNEHYQEDGIKSIKTDNRTQNLGRMVASALINLTQCWGHRSSSMLRLRWKHTSIREYDRKRPNRTNLLEPPETKYMSKSRYIARRSNTRPPVHHISSRTKLPNPVNNKSVMFKFNRRC